MSSKACSPGAALLRNSRLMSLPPPLPPQSTANILRRSSTPYPTHQVIATHDSSRARGDWGLKYNLPHKVPQKYLKYRDLDTLEHRTTFEGAHGEVQFVQKIREIGMPLTQSREADNYQFRAHAFEEIEWIDDGRLIGQHSNTQTQRGLETGEVKKDSKPIRSRHVSVKWRFAGPHLQSLTPAQLRRYILKKVKPRREEFYAFVQKHEAEQHEHFEASGLHDPAEDANLIPVESKKVPVDINRLRGDPLKLETHVTRFLDLPLFSAPPQTHPCGGLLYHRSTHLPNDPFTGPAPTPYRSIPGRPFGLYKGFQLAGVAGVIAQVLNAGSFGPSDNRELIRHYSPEWIAIKTDGSTELQVSNALYPPSEKPDIEAIRERQFRESLEKRSREAAKAAEAITLRQVKVKEVRRAALPKATFPAPGERKASEATTQLTAEEQNQIIRDAFANATDSVLSMLEDVDSQGESGPGRARPARGPGMNYGIRGGRVLKPRS